MNSMSVLLVGCGILILAFGLLMMFYLFSMRTTEVTFAVLFIGGGVCIAASVAVFKVALRQGANLIYP